MLLVVDEVVVLEEPGAAVVALEPTRARLLASLSAEPASAAALAARLGLPRQRVGHHLRALEGQGLVVEVDRRRHGGLTERVLTTSGRAYVVSPAAMGEAGAEPERVADRLSAAYLIALAGRVVRELGTMVGLAAKADKRLPVLSIDADVRFASAADRAAFADELAAAVRGVVARHHDESAPDGRWYRVVVMSHPRPSAGPSGDQAADEESPS
ncbi:MAG: helix-turn-helix domain-containing protein [Actinomycetota bacterium]|nr:helix-turn-helix domain-containing protein [Actinomycetota bacterium]